MSGSVGKKEPRVVRGLVSRRKGPNEPRGRNRVRLVLLRNRDEKNNLPRIRIKGEKTRSVESTLSKKDKNIDIAIWGNFQPDASNSGRERERNQLESCYSQTGGTI